MIRSAVLIQYTRVRQTDRRTDGIGVAYTRYSIYAVARKNEAFQGTDFLYFLRTELKGIAIDLLYDGTNHRPRASIKLTKIVHSIRDCDCV